MITLDDVRTSHSEGRTFAVYSHDRNLIVTAGSDGDIHVYPGLYDEETSSKSLNTKITCLDVAEDLLVVSTDHHEVKLYNFPELTVLQSLLMRFTAPITFLCIAAQKQAVAAASSDFTVKTVEVDGTNQKLYTGHTAPVLSLCVNDEKNILISNSCDGTIRVWSTVDQKCTKVLNVLPKLNRAPEYLGVMSLGPKCLAVPSENAIKLFSLGNWTEESFPQTSLQHKEKISCLAFSPCGNFVASASTNGEIVIWELHDRNCIQKCQHHEGKGVTSLQWKGKESGELLFATMDGEFGFCTVALSSAKDDAAERPPDVMLIAKSKKRRHEDDHESEDDDGFDGSTVKKRHRVNNVDNFLDDEADDVDDDDPNVSLNLIKEGLLPQLNKLPLIDEDDESRASLPVQEIKVLQPATLLLQKPFQPSSTPKHLMHRFMTWNSVGIIRCHSEDEISSIDIEFHNSNTHHPLHLANILNNTMATMSNAVVVLACESEMDDTPSKITCLHFSTWDTNKEWSMAMPKQEDIQVVAANDTHVVVATNCWLLRIFSIGGVQTQLLRLPGSVVTMAMHDKQIVLFYNKAPGLCFGVLHFTLTRGNKWKMNSDETLNVKPDVQLVWLGFSAEGSPVFVDSSGDVFVYQRAQSLWVPVTNTRKQVKNKSDNFWVIGVEEEQAKVRCILCKGANIPTTLPRPVPTFIPFQLPLCEMKNEKSIKEHELVRTELALSNVKSNVKVLAHGDDRDVSNLEKQQVQLLMQLFALACKSDRDFRAVEICRLMPSVETIGLAIQYASKMHRMNLARKLDDLARQRAVEVESQLEDEEIGFSDDDDFDIEALDENEDDKSTNEGRKTNSCAVSGNDLSNEEEILTNRTSDKYVTNKSNTTKATSSVTNKVVNPFKVKPTSNSNVRATERFESLEREKQTAKIKKQEAKIESMKKTTAKQPAKGQKKITLPSKSKKILKQDPKPTKKMSGFQMFLQEKQGHDDSNGHTSPKQEDVLQQTMKLWKLLTVDEKKIWIEKAAQKMIEKNRISETVLAEKNLVANSSGKEKLNSFAFKKNES